MVLDAMETGVYIWKGLRFSISTCYRSVRNHPFVLGIMLFFFILNRFLPCVFRLLVSSSPILVCTAVFLRTILSFGDKNSHNVEEEESAREISTLKSEKDHRISLCVGKRKDMEEKIIIEERGISNGGVAKHGKEENDCVFSTIHNDGLLGRNVMIVDKLKEFRKEATEGLKSGTDRPSVDAPEADTSELCHKSNVGYGDLEAESKEDEDEQEGQEDGTKAVAWTEDDEKNLMDLGTSELERNQRLKRRARKLLKLQADKNLIDLDTDVPPSQIATISTVRNNPFNIPYNSNETIGLPPLPVSAPSVLLPTRNPFDLPYDPLEERPNLMGDSFQQEFIAVPHKDMRLCRHESFSLATSFFGELKQDMHSTKLSHCLVTERRPLEGANYPIFHGQLGEMRDSNVSSAPEIEPPSSIADQEKPIEGEPISHTDSAPYHAEQEIQPFEQVIDSMETDQEKKRDVDLGMVEIEGEDKEISNDMDLSLADTSEVYVKPEVVNEEDYSKSRSSSSSEGNEQTFSANKGEGSGNLELKMGGDCTKVIINPIQTSLTDLDPKYSIVEGVDHDSKTKEPLYDSSPSTLKRTTTEDSIFYMDKEVFLTSTFSIASELEVEVSEVGSPPVTIERTISFTDREFSLYDGSTKMEFESGNDGLLEVDDNESRSREATEISDRDVLRFGFSGVNQNSDDPIASTALPESVVEHISIPSSSSSLMTGLPERPKKQATPSNSDPKIHVEVQQFEVENVEPMAFNTSDGLSPEDLTSPEREKVHDLMEKSTIHPSSDGDSNKPQERSNPLGKFTEEANTIYNAKELAIHENEDIQNLKLVEDIGGESQALIKHEAVANPSKMAEGSDISKSIEDTDHKSEKITKYEANNSRSIEDVEGESHIIIKHGPAVNLSITAEESDTSKSFEDIEGKSKKMTSKPAEESDN